MMMASLSKIWDHPRVCGEHDCVPEDLPEDSGSSPRMRGTLFAILTNCLSAGIIPAYAGNTYCFPVFSRVRWDHPRVCGEHCCGMAWFIATTGSSPRMRGTHTVFLCFRAFVGIIPAYAGNTVVGWRGLLPRRDHPRVCGEHILFSCVFARSLGSSPRMRGTQDHCRWGEYGSGIIPAYAGNTH